jgi:hypothetical protein
MPGYALSNTNTEKRKETKRTRAKKKKERKKRMLSAPLQFQRYIGLVGWIHCARYAAAAVETGSFPLCRSCPSPLSRKFEAM